jgi:GNAT superfamily N-acetyltransferase
VDLSNQHQGLGEYMLVEALRACLRAAGVIGVRAVIVHAKDAHARGFYGKYGFEASPTHPLHLMMLMKDVRKNLAG